MVRSNTNRFMKATTGRVYGLRKERMLSPDSEMCQRLESTKRAGDDREDVLTKSLHTQASSETCELFASQPLDADRPRVFAR